MPVASWRVHPDTSIDSSGFIEHYLLAAIYPAGLTRNAQVVLRAIVVVLNVSIYASLLSRWWTSRKANA